MQDISLIKKNILKYIDFKGISKYKFYQETGITRGVLDQNNGMSEENTTRFIACYPEVSVEWLLTGIGQMLKQNTHKILTLTPIESGDLQNKDNENFHISKTNSSDSDVSDFAKAIDRMAEIIKTNAEIEKEKKEIEKINALAHAESIRLNAEIEKAKVEVERVKAEAEKTNAEANKMNAEVNDRNSKSMEIMISSLLGSGKTPHEKKRTTSENSP